jgi:hypothetical protein
MSAWLYFGIALFCVVFAIFAHLAVGSRIGLAIPTFFAVRQGFWRLKVARGADPFDLAAPPR